MRKLVSFILVVAVLSAVCGSLAESTGTGAESPFVFRDGIKWGMSVDEVKAIEGIPNDRAEEEAYCLLLYMDRRVSKYDCRLIYCFESDQLVMVNYVLEGNGDLESFRYLNQAYDSRYTEEKDVDATEFYRFVEKLNPGAYTKEQAVVLPLLKWNAEGNTAVWLCMEEGKINIYYISPAFLPAESQEKETENTPEPIDTTGI